MKTENFISALAFVRAAAGKKDVRYYLNGVCFDVTPHRLTFVGCDGHRMALAEVAEDAFTPITEGQVILDNDALDLIAAMFKKAKGDCELSIVPRTGEDAGAVVVNGMTFKGMDGRFPDWRRVRAAVNVENPQGDCYLNANYLAEASKAAAKLSSEKWPGVRVRMAENVNDAVCVHLMPSAIHYLQLACAEVTIMTMRR